jgi:hypothetical protein
MQIDASPRMAILVAIASAIVLMLLWGPREEVRISPRYAAVQGESRPVANTAPVPIALQLSDELYADQRAALDGELSAALAYVSDRFGSPPSGAITAVMRADGGCALAGVAYTDIREVRVSTCESIPRARAVAILAHEFVHQLAQDRYGQAHLSADLILAEGVATWGAGSYWLGGQPDFRSAVREQRRRGDSYPLATHYAGLGAGAMNTLYYQWASFVEYLIGAYGREAFDRLYISGAGDPGSARYTEVYGKDLATLEREWEQWLEQ